MPADNQEVLDDFIMDMDIETITLDDMQVKESDKSQDGHSPEMIMTEQANNQFFGDLKMDKVNIEEIKLGEPGGASQQSLFGGDGKNITINIEHASIAGDLKGDIVSEGKGGIREKAAREREAEKTKEETPPVGTGLSDVPEVDIPDFNIGTAPGVPISIESPDEDFLKNVESDITLGELNKIEETPEPSIPLDMPSDENAAAYANVPEVEVPQDMEALKDSAVFSSEDDIIFIDGNELDKMVYGSGKGLPEASINDVPVIEETSFDHFQEEPLQPEEKEETISVSAFQRKESVPLAEEIISEEVPGSSLDMQPLSEGVISENDTALEQIEVHFDEGAKEPEFNFDLSVIPDVEMVEDDEPIALSIDELNKIDISDESVMGFDASAVTPEAPAIIDEDEKIGISLDELNEIQKDISPVQTKDEKARFIEQQLEALSGQSKDELKSVLSYLDKLLEDLPEDRIKEFAKSDYYDLYVKILDKLGV
jgi:hypothetical protein